MEILGSIEACLCCVVNQTERAILYYSEHSIMLFYTYFFRILTLITHLCGARGAAALWDPRQVAATADLLPSPPSLDAAPSAALYKIKSI